SSMYEKLAIAGGKLLVETLVKIEDGTVVYTKQDESLATHAPMLKKEEGLLDFKLSAWSLDCLIRGFKEWPTAYTYVGGKLLKVYGAKAVSSEKSAQIEDNLATKVMPGCFIVTKKNIYVKTGENLLELLEVQPEGKKRMPAMDFARGQHIETGMNAGNIQE
ncbi:MAG: methionyl-tRNA formyltransferase, partial [Lachnospiraceae bacterium]|nr:methionyl-tRNA formyltransferase [Lachnospiraceae bacterium]